MIKINARSGENSQELRRENMNVEKKKIVEKSCCFNTYFKFELRVCLIYFSVLLFTWNCFKFYMNDRIHFCRSRERLRFCRISVEGQIL